MGQPITAKTLIDQTYSSASSCLSAVKSFQEYCETYTKKVLSFLEDTNLPDSTAIAISVPIDESTSKVATISREMYNQALNDEEELISVVIDDVGTTVDVTGKQITDAVENSVCEVKLQSEFLKLSLENIENKSTDLATNIKAKFSSISGDAIEKYQNLWVPNNPIRSIQNLISSKNNLKLKQDENGGIEIFDPTEFGSANVWLSAFEEIGDTISSFFEGIWRGIQDLGGFFERLLDSFVNFAKWLMSKAFGQLLTNYEKGGERIGYIDIPFIQIPICNLYFVKDANGQYVSDPVYTGSKYNYATDSASEEYHMIRSDSHLTACRSFAFGSTRSVEDIHSEWTHVTLNPLKNNHQVLWGTEGYVRQALNLSGVSEKLYEIVGSGDAPRLKILTKTVDIVIPCSNEQERFSSVEEYSGIPFSPMDVLVRYGLVQLSDNAEETVYAIVMQCFAMDTWDNVNAVPDKVTACRIRDSVYSLIAFLYTKYWSIAELKVIPPVPWSDARANQLITDAVNQIIDVSDISRSSYPDAGTYDLASKLLLIDSLDTLNLSTSSGVWHDFITADDNHQARLNVCCLVDNIIAYTGLCGPGFIKPSTLHNITIRTSSNGGIRNLSVDTVIPFSQVLYDTNNTWGFNPFDPEYITSDYPVAIDYTTGRQLFQDNSAAYTPYASYYGYGVTVHYQTTVEQIHEAKVVIIAAIIAIVGVTLTILTSKFIKNRKLKLELAQGYRDNYAWNLPANPSKEQIKEYKRARKKANKISRLNGFLGISSESSNSASIIDTVSAVSDQLLATQGALENSDNTNVPTVKQVYSAIVGE